MRYSSYPPDRVRCPRRATTRSEDSPCRGSRFPRRDGKRRWLAPLPLLLLLGGCASIAPFKGVTLHDDAVYVSDVTPIRQDKTYACGAACVAAVAAHWGVSFADFKAKYPSAASDATGADLQAMAQNLGLTAFAYQGSFDDLRDNLSKGRPMIAMIPVPLVARGGLVSSVVLNTWNEIGPRPAHWITIVGLIGRDSVVVNDPSSGPLLIRWEKFNAWWAQKGNLCVLIARNDVGDNSVGRNP